MTYDTRTHIRIGGEGQGDSLYPAVIAVGGKVSLTWLGEQKSDNTTLRETVFTGYIQGIYKVRYLQ